MFLTIFLPLTLSLAAGYGARKLGLLGERTAKWVMTAVTIIGYPVVNLLALWNTPLSAKDIWLPLQSVAQMLVLAAAAIPLANLLTKDRGERGVFAITSAFGNHGLTMGGFVVLLIASRQGQHAGEQALGLASIYFMFFAPMTVLLAYPLARHYSTEQPSGSLARLLVRSIFDWRSIGLPISLLGIMLSPAVFAVPRPEFVARWNLVGISVYAINIAAYFGIGLQLRMSYVPVLKRLIAALAFSRFFLGAATGLGLIAITWLTPWPLDLHSTAGMVVMVESFVSTAVTCVAVSTLFHLRPREASVLFVTNTLLYLMVVLPIVFWIFG